MHPRPRHASAISTKKTLPYFVTLLLMLARSCHRVSLTTRGPAFRHLRSRHPPPRHAPDPSCPPRRPPGGSCASLLPPPRHPPVPIFPCQDLLRAKKMLTLGVLLPSLILIFSVDSISSHFRGKCVDTRGSTRYQRSRRPRARVDEHAAGPRRHPALVRSESLRGLNPRFLGSPVQEPTVRARLRPELLGQPPVGRLHLFGTRKKQPQASCGTGRERAATQRGQIEPGGGD